MLTEFVRTRDPARRRYRLVYLLAVAGAAACGGDKATAPSTNPLPVLVSAAPAQLVLGSGATTVTLTGSGFVPSSQARWNDADRSTHYQNAQTLTVDLTAADLSTLSTGRFSVTNGAPGGGTSGLVSAVIVYPTPTIATVTPNTSQLQSNNATGSLAITITGTGFVGQSVVRVGGSYVAQASVTPTQLVANVPNYLFNTAGTVQVTVVNPSPGGGTSNAVDFGVAYPVPTVASFSPDSSFTGAAFTLTVNGTGFGSGSVVRWNGADRPTTFVSATRLTAAIPASDVGSGTSATVLVFNPAPGGGASNAMPYRIREAAPVLMGINPGTVTVGSGATPVTLTGTNFRAGATAQWDGQDRAATVTSTTSMAVTLAASDLATARVGKLTVTNVGASGTSNAMALAVVAAGASLAVARTVTLTHTDLVADDARAVLYASVPSSAAQYANTIVRVDPVSGAVTGSVAVGSDPGPVAITDDGQYLYVGLRGASKVVRVALASFSKDIELPLGGDSFFGSTYAEDLVPIPGAPQTVAVSTFYTGLSPRNAGTVLFDNDVRRAATGPGHTGSNRITRGPTAARIYGYNNETTEFGFRSVLVAADGLHEEAVRSGLVSGFGVDIEYSGGFVYATTGEVVDPGAMQKFGTIPANGVVRPDAPNARVHFLSNGAIRTFHYTAFTSLGSFSDASLNGHTKLIRWGTDGLAVGGGTTIVLLRGGLVAP